jgi:imidazolonepropionase-like amidohydrolase
MDKALCFAGCLLSLLPATNLARADPIVLRADRVFTAEDRQAHPGWVVVVEGNRILEAGPSATVAVPPSARAIDLPGATLLPGLIDAHSHLFLHPYNEALWDDQVLKESTPCWQGSPRCAIWVPRAPARRMW